MAATAASFPRPGPQAYQGPVRRASSENANTRRADAQRQKAAIVLAVSLVMSAERGAPALPPPNPHKLRVRRRRSSRRVSRATAR